MTTLAFTRNGSGPPLVLLHGLGSSRRAWDPIVPALAERFDVIAIDLPGFGQSAPMTAGVEPTPGALAVVVAQFLDELGVDTAHLAGNSVGGWVALELAHIRATASITLLSPAGLWATTTPRYNQISLRTSRWLAQHAGTLLARVVRYRVGRVVVLGQTHGRPSRLTAEHARQIIATIAECSGFEDTLDATINIRYLARSPIDAPVTVAFGSRDRLLLVRQSRHLDQLPAGTRLATLPGCGHVPMSDDPEAVANVILTSSFFDCQQTKML
jgi:pimeloyl-ACP methyl ester carboxylesterase